jgi:hypothetical protein
MSNSGESRPTRPSIAPRLETGVFKIPRRQEGTHYNLKEAKAPLELPLTDEQSDVLFRVQGLVNEMAAREFSPPRTPDFLPRIEPLRESRIILIDGDSGSGKTSIMLTLIDDWGRLISPRQNGATELIPPVPVFPIGILDLQPLPPSTNLTLHLASTLQKVIDTVESDVVATPSAATPPWHPMRQQELRSRASWRKFVSAAVAASDIDLLQRRDLDPEALVLELEETERERLDVTKAFFRLVDALVQDLADWKRVPGTQQPFLILAIDDADTNPHFSVALLNLLRRLYHPRLAYLLTGNTELFLTMLSMHFLHALFGPIKGMSLGESDMNGVRHESAHLARLTYDRLVPDRQRCRIADLPRETRLDKLRDSLRKLGLSTQALVGMNTIAIYFDLVPRLALALPNTMRGIADLRAHLLLRDSAPEEIKADIRMPEWLVKHLWDSTVRTIRLNPEERELIESRVVITEHGNLRVDADHMTWNLSRRPLFHVTCEAPFTALVSQAGSLGLSFLVPGRAARSLPPTAVSAFMLANIVAFDDDEDVFVSRPGIESPFDRHLITIEYNLDDADKLRFGWPLPDPTLLLDIEIISERWKTALDEVPDAFTVELSQWALFFLKVAIETARTRNPGGIKLDHQVKNASVWDGVGQDLKVLMSPLGAPGTYPTRQLRFAEWAQQQAGLLAAPESGLPPEDVEGLLNGIKKAVSDDEWRCVARSLRAARLIRAAHALDRAKQARGKDEDLEKLVKRIDDECPKSPWHDLIGSKDQPMSEGASTSMNPTSPARF